MIILADSGSTKTDWALLTSKGEKTIIQSKGLNPFLVSDEEFKSIVTETFEGKGIDVTEVYFYGAGCTPSMRPKVKLMLESVFPSAIISAQSDLVSAAHALFGAKPGITAILGTGSIVGYYNGTEIEKTIPSLGYVLGDEGSGNAMGKMLIRDFLRKTMPEDLYEKFKQRFSISMDKVLHSVYKESAANRYLAQFTLFLSENIDQVYCQQLVKNNFETFVKNCILLSPYVRQIPVGFMGSIAHAFQKQLKEVLEEAGIRSYKIIKAPIHALVDYHLSQQKVS